MNKLFHGRLKYLYGYMMIKIFLLTFLFYTSSCSSLHSLKDKPSAEELFQHAENLKEKSYYKEALAHFKRLKSRFLYSRFSKLADLAIADIHFAKEEWEKASRAYDNFYSLNPRHKKSDYALFRLSLSYFHQLPLTEDRDLSLSKKTLFYIKKQLKLFPKSPYRAVALEHQKKVLTLLAKKQWMIARFHLKQNRLHSAKPYMLKLLKDYSFLLPKEENPSVKKTDDLGAEEHSFAKKKYYPSKKLPSLKKLKVLIQKNST